MASLSKKPNASVISEHGTDDDATTDSTRSSSIPSDEQSIAMMKAYRASDIGKPIDALQLQDDIAPTAKQFKGQRRIWPGAVLLITIIVATIGLTVYYGIKTRQDALERDKNKLLSKRIDDGTDGMIEDGSSSSIITGPADDPDSVEYRNPKVYPIKNCLQTNYVSKNGAIYAEAGGLSKKVAIKGVNWSGMETSSGIPFGLWDNIHNGTTVFEIASFLARNNFNSVRIPLAVSNLLDNIVPDKTFINSFTNKAIKINSYMDLLKSIIKALGYRQISVLLDIQNLTPEAGDHYWYSDAVPEEKVLSAINILTDNLCDPDYWNVIGVDVKNEPWKATWGDNTPIDFRLGATKLSNEMLNGCPNWLAFIQGVVGSHTVKIDNKNVSYYDWWGGGLQKAGALPVNLKIENKVVYAPHYYSPSVSPQTYMYKSYRRDGLLLQNFQELDTETLRKNTIATMNDMFGYLTLTNPKAAVVLGEFGGLFSADVHPQKTTQRVIDITIDAVANSVQYAGAYVWAINPESNFQYNPADTYGNFYEGILKDDWLSTNKNFLLALKRLDAKSNISPFPCFTT